MAGGGGADGRWPLFTRFRHQIDSNGSSIHF